MKLSSMKRLWTNRNAISVPTITEAANAISVTFSVLQSPCNRTGQPSASDLAMSTGAGNRYFGTSQ